MASPQTIQELIDYYVNLLIIQYHNQPKAQATIALFAEVLLANGIALDVLNGYNLIPSQFPPGTWDQPLSIWDAPDEMWDEGLSGVAIGAQLDIIGKYVGLNRYFPELIITDYFALVPYSQYNALPSSPPEFGCSTYANFNNYSYNGTLQYNDLVTTNEALTDANFYTLIQLAIIQNNMNYSFGAIDRLLFQFFGTNIRAEYPSAMHMVFFISSALTPLMQAILYKKLLPVPIAVGALVVSNINNLVFGFTDYAGNISPFASGCSTYANYDTLSGQVLTYNQITPV